MIIQFPLMFDVSAFALINVPIRSSLDMGISFTAKIFGGFSGDTFFLVHPPFVVLVRYLDMGCASEVLILGELGMGNCRNPIF